MTAVLLDTGPLVAYLCAREERHGWARAQLEGVTGPMTTCEAVWAEAAYLIRERGGNPDELWKFLRRGMVEFAFDLETEFESVAVLCAATWMCRWTWPMPAWCECPSFTQIVVC